MAAARVASISSWRRMTSQILILSPGEIRFSALRRVWLRGLGGALIFMMVDRKRE
jgi:hypothetical protein